MDGLTTRQKVDLIHASLVALLRERLEEPKDALEGDDHTIALGPWRTPSGWPSFDDTAAPRRPTLTNYALEKALSQHRLASMGIANANADQIADAIKKADEAEDEIRRLAVKQRPLSREELAALVDVGRRPIFVERDV